MQRTESSSTRSTSRPTATSLSETTRFAIRRTRFNWTAAVIRAVEAKGETLATRFHATTGRQSRRTIAPFAASSRSSAHKPLEGSERLFSSTCESDCAAIVRRVVMHRLGLSFLVVFFLLSWLRTSEAHLVGFESGGCTGCHHDGKTPTVTITASSATVMAGQQVTLTVAISAVNGPAGGFYIPAPSAGKFTAQAGERLWPDGGITHSMPARTTGSQVVFQVLWTAPTAPPMGGVDFPVFAVSANGNGSNSGDGGGESFLSLAYGCGVGTKYYRDNDGDHYGVEQNGFTMNCSPPPFYAVQQGDCNDNDPTVYPGAPEICDGKDNNCNGQIDEGLESVKLCEDKDGDGHGVLNGATKVGCSGTNKGFGACDGDCDDNNPKVYPGAPEICNFIDDNCNGMVDEGARPTCGEGWCRRYGSSCTSNDCTPGQPRAEQC